jgi:hypothetical protein
MFMARTFPAALVALAVTCTLTHAQAQTAVGDPSQFGPYNGSFLPDGLGLAKPIADAHDPILLADSPWSLVCWVRTSEPVTGLELVAGVGNTSAEYPRYLAVDAGKIALWMGKGNQLTGPANLIPNEWHLLATSKVRSSRRTSTGWVRSHPPTVS